MGIAGNIVPGADAAAARYVFGPLTLIGAVVVAMDIPSAGSIQSAGFLLTSAVILFGASLIPFSRNQRNVQGWIRPALIMCLYVFLIVFGAGFYVQA